MAKLYTELCKIISTRFWEWLAEMLQLSAFLGWAAEHFEGDSPNLAGMFLRIYVQGVKIRTLAARGSCNLGTFMTIPVDGINKFHFFSVISFFSVAEWIQCY